MTNRPRSEQQTGGQGITPLQTVHTLRQTPQSPIESLSSQSIQRPMPQPAIKPVEPSTQSDSGFPPFTEAKTEAAFTPNFSPLEQNPSNQIKPKQRKIPWGKITLATITAIAVGGGILLAKFVPINNLDWMGLLKGRNPEEVFVEALGRKLDRPLQILVLGIDRVPGAPLDSPESFNGRSDTMLLIRFDPYDRSLTILSVPRDTQVPIPGAGRTKINAANVYGGAALAKSTVSETLNDVNIDHYVRIDTAGLVDLVDVLGGLEVNVPKRMRYVDKTQKLDIDLYPGVQVLNGKQAEGFVRFRHDEEGDIGRIKRQQVLLKALKAKLSNPTLVLKLNDLVTVLRRHVDTDLSFDEMLALGTFSLSLKPNQVQSFTLPGRPSDPNEFRYSYWITTPEQAAQAIDGKFQVKRQDTSNSQSTN
ncbi:LCP family protein [Tumidithrix elongata RA019]|uniref:LCP family protein n=1 Tax=Tumidithrix elongata BACA0141 TaxID=2716417 RepID=A0AAW9PZU5_9CYAN|nr:LCP family protein [Tumidithrix elongata RA019]